MKVKIQTMLGDIIVRLYDETPVHRDNFVKLVKDGYYEGRSDRPVDDIEMRMTVIE